MHRRVFFSPLLATFLILPGVLRADAQTHDHHGAGAAAAPAQTRPRTPAKAAPAPAQSSGSGGVHVAQVAPKFYVISNAMANLVLLVGDDASFVAGPQYPALVNQAIATVREQKAPAVKYVFITDDDSAPALLDGGWGQRGAVTIAHEQLVGSMMRPASGTNAVTPAPGAAPPAMGFSQVVQLHIKGEDTHIVHDKVGYSAADAIIHFEGSGVAYLGPAFTNDGYPRIDIARGGKLSGMIELVDFFATNFAQSPQMIEPIIPGRGPIATIRDLQAYRDMLRTVRERVLAIAKAGKSVQDAIAAKPTAEFDARWGHGPLTPDQFVTLAYESVRREQ
jgi:cyclase